MDPSDPLNVNVGRTEEGSDSRALQEDDADLEVETEVEVGDDGRNVSRERLQAPSDYDPWNALSSNPGSPRGGGALGWGHLTFMLKEEENAMVILKF